MAFGKKQQPQSPPSMADLIGRHQRAAESELDRAAKAGRLEAETRHAALGTGHAVMALLCYLQMRDGYVAPGTKEAAQGLRWAPLDEAARFKRVQQPSE